MFYISVEAKFETIFLKYLGQDDVVSIAASYGVGGAVIESQWRRDFPHPSRPVLGTAQPALQLVPVHYWGCSCWGVILTTHYPYR